jgi:hypothetical protein
VEIFSGALQAPRRHTDPHRVSAQLPGSLRDADKA